jgi:tRNA-dihydrouridine synthase B
MRIGPYELGGIFTLAPMAGITDAPFRRLCRQFGAAMATSEMTTADIGLWQTAKSRRRLDLELDADPCVVQIAGSEPGQLATAARLCVDRGAQISDVNMGCPAKKVCRKAAGSALLRDPDLVRRILAAVIGAVDVPVTLKMRTGWDRQHRNGLDIARIAEDAGVQFDTIAQIKSAVGIPVLANGDIDTPEKSLEVLRLTSADGLMIGRAARGRPWIFRELNHFLETGKHPAPLENNDVRDIMLDHLSDLYQFYGETTGVRVARKHLTWYCAGLNNAQEFRSQVVRAANASEQIRLTRDFFGDNSGDKVLAA